MLCWGVAQKFSITLAESKGDIDAARGLFELYAASLPVDLGYQGFPDELAMLPGQYAGPCGRLLLARNLSGLPVGCVALRPLSEPGDCEMKRLFVLASTRGWGLGRALVLRLIREAAQLGYDRLRLDTLDSLTEASALYESLAFARIPAYYAPVPAGTSFMELDLQPRRESAPTRR